MSGTGPGTNSNDDSANIRKLIALTPRGNRRSAECPHELSAVYDYSDEDGCLLFQVVRREPKEFFQPRPDGQGSWINRLDDTWRVLYRLRQLMAADPGEPVFVVEGEKDAERLAGLGLIATTNPQGAGKWRDEYSMALAGRDVVLVADNDDAGTKHGRAVAESLSSVVRRVRVLRLPELPPKGDVSDRLDAGGTAEELLRLVAGTCEWSQHDVDPARHVGVLPM